MPRWKYLSVRLHPCPRCDRMVPIDEITFHKDLNMDACLICRRGRGDMYGIEM